MRKMFLSRRCLPLALACAVVSTTAAAQPSYPSKPVVQMVPYAAGGPSDATARLYNEPLSKALGQPVMVENLGGATGAIAARKVLSAPADGYYLFRGTPNEVILGPLASVGAKFKPEEFRLIAPTGSSPLVVVARKDLPANNVDELIALARRSSNQPLNYGSVGIGSLYHLILERVQQITGVTFNHAPYKGNAPVLQDIGGGNLDFAVLGYSASMAALADQGRLKILGQLEGERSEFLKDVPTVSESKALKGFTFSIWGGLLVRRDTPDAIVQRLHQAIAVTLSDPEVKAQLRTQMQQPFKVMSLAEAAAFYQSEITRYRAIAASINLQPQ